MKPHRKPKATTSTAVTVLETHSTDLALPADLIGKAKDYEAKSRSERTIKEYQKWFAKFVRWCDANSRSPIPASPETLSGFITWLASGQDKARPLAIASINVAVAAIKFAHRAGGHVLDTDHPRLQAIWSGIRREIAKTRTVKQVRPILGEDLREMLEMLRPDVPREARDAAILALGWSGALRRSELVALDLERIGTEGARGFITIDDRGITITLMTSKASQEAAETVIIPRQFTPFSCRAIENWIKVGEVKSGTPLFRGVKGPGWSVNLPQSGYKGVTWNARQNKWQVVTQDENSKRKFLGYHVKAWDGHVAYCKYKGLTPSRVIDKAIAEQRIHPTSVAVMIKSRIRMLVEARNADRSRKKMTREEIADVVAKFSGHSMRAGYATTAADKGMSIHRIKSQTRHKGDAMVMGYVRIADKYKSSGLDGVGV